jgi:hypothetical protein
VVTQASGFSGSIHITLGVLIAVAVFATAALLIGILLMRRK